MLFNNALATFVCAAILHVAHSQNVPDGYHYNPDNSHVYSTSDGSLFEGDILLTESEAIARFRPKEANKMQDNGFLFLDDKAEEMRDDSPSRHLGAITKNPFSLWPDRFNIPYGFAEDFLPGDRDAVLSALDHISSSGVVTFSEINYSQPPTSYIEYTSQTAGCSGSIGRFPERPTIVNLGLGCTTRQSIIMHETLHALGFFHEHDRPDRDDHVVIHVENIRQGFLGAFSKQDANSNGLPYDLNSVMHLGEKDFSANGLNTITTVDPTLQNLIASNPNKLMSSLDHETLRRMYGLTPSLVTSFQSSTDFSVASGFYGIEINEIGSDDDNVVLPHHASYVSSTGQFRWRSVSGGDQDTIYYRGKWNRETGSGIDIVIDVADQFKAFGVTLTDNVWPTGADRTAAILKDAKGFFRVDGLGIDQPMFYLPTKIDTINLKATVNGITGNAQAITVNVDGNPTNADEYFEKIMLTGFPENTNGGEVEVQGIKEMPGFSEGAMFWLPDGTNKLFKYRGVANGYTGSIWNTFRVVKENGGGDDSSIVDDGELDVSGAFQSVTIQNLEPNVAVEIKSNNLAISIDGDADAGADQVFDMPLRTYKWRVIVNGNGGAFKDNVVAAGVDWTIDASSFFCTQLVYSNQGDICPSPVLYPE